MSTGALAAERCRILYEYLIRKGDQWTETINACEDLCGYYPYVEWLVGVDAPDFHDSNARMMITNDIRLINESGNFEKIIISGKGALRLRTRKRRKNILRINIGQFSADSRGFGFFLKRRKPTDRLTFITIQ